MNTLEAISIRRSIRKFAELMPDKILLEKIVEAGRMAPSGGNNQKTRFIIIGRKDVLGKLAEIAQDAFREMDYDENTYPSLRSSIIASKSGNYVFHYNAPVLIIVANKKGYGNSMADSICAMENMMLAAVDLGLGSCYINQLHWLTDNEKLRNFLYEFGLKEDEEINASLALGYPSRDYKPKEKVISGNPVDWIL